VVILVTVNVVATAFAGLDCMILPVIPLITSDDAEAYRLLMSGG
jgi:hypothetical protein